MRKDDEVRLRHMLDSAREALPRIPWADIIAMRNRLIHAYYDIDLDILWKTLTEDIPPLAEELQKTVKPGG